MANQHRSLFTLPISVEGGEAVLKLTLMLTAAEECLPGSGGLGSENSQLPAAQHSPSGYPPAGPVTLEEWWAVWKAGAPSFSFFFIKTGPTPLFLSLAFHFPRPVVLPVRSPGPHHLGP